MRSPSLECRRKPVFWHGGLELMNVVELSFISCLYAGREFLSVCAGCSFLAAFLSSILVDRQGGAMWGASWVSMALTGTLHRCLLRSDFWGLYNFLSFLPSLFWFSNRVSHWSMGPGIHCVTQAGLKLATVLWPQPPRYWDYRLEVPHLEDSFHVLLSGPLFNHVHFALYESRFTNLFVLVYVCPEHYWPYKPLDICYGHHKWLLRTEARLWGQWPQRCLAHSHKHRAAVPLPVKLVTWSSICWALGIKMSAFSVCHPKLLSNQNSQLISPTLFPLNFSVALGFEISAPLPC